MPTPESADAFKRLTAAHAHLNDVTSQLNQCHARFWKEGQTAQERYAELQIEWDEAFSAYRKATEQFAATIEKVHQKVEAHRLSKIEWLGRWQ